jgi:cell division protein FtsB
MMFFRQKANLGDSQSESLMSLYLQPLIKEVVRGRAMNRSTSPALGVIAYFCVTFALGLYFTFAAVQGDYGLFRRAEILADADVLRTQLSGLQAEVFAMENKTKRLSDDYLDLDLLDEQARSVVGMARADEIIIR